MPNTLGTVTLPDQVVWEDMLDWSAVASQVERTLSGGLAIFTQPRNMGRPVTLRIKEGVAWLDQAQVDSIMSMASQLGATFIFIYQSQRHNVRFAHHGQQAVQLAPIRPQASQYTGTIKLITV